MNYMAEIKAFYDWLELNPLPPPAIVLWHALMHIANKSGWQPEFTVAVSVLATKTGLNAKAIERARNSLTQSGRIAWKNRGGNQSSKYTLFSLCDIYTYDFVAQSVVQPVAQSVAQSVVQPVAQSVAINRHKLNDTKNIKKNIKEIFFPDDEKLNSTFSDFVAMRKSLKNGAMTEKAIGMMIEKLSKVEADVAIKMLEESILNNWKDVYPLKNTSEQQSKNTKNQFQQFPQRKIDYDDLVMQQINGLPEGGKS